MAHYDAKQLEEYKKEDLIKIAEELGVSTDGNKKEIAARCAEVDIPDETEQTDKTEQPDETAQADETDETEQPDDGKVTVECVQNYKDLELKRIVKAGEQHRVTPERAAYLAELRLVKKI
jgi:hypothetical protein